MARWKPERARKKEPGPVHKARLISCLVALIGTLVFFYLLFSAFLQR